MKPGVTTIFSEDMKQQIVAMISLNRSIKEIAKELNISYASALRFTKRDDVKAAVDHIRTQSVQAAKVKIRHEVSKLVDKIIDVINKQLDEGSIEAVKVALKIVGFNDQEPVNQSAQSITVLLPGSDAGARTIEVPNEAYQSRRPSSSEDV